MPDITKEAADEAAKHTLGEPVPTAGPAVVEAAAEVKTRSLWGDAWADLRRRPMFIISALIILLLVVMSAFPGLFTGTDPTATDLQNHFLSKPKLGHFFQADWLGYDQQGRSVYARVVHGTRNSVLVGFGATVIVTLLGSLVGMVAGYFGGWLDAVLSRITDIFFGIPFLLGAMLAMNAFTDRKWWLVAAALGILGWTQITRVMRGSVITVKQSDYVQAAKALGASTSRIMIRHILPNAMAPVIVVSTIALGSYIGAEATLSFLGLGLSAPAVSWGADISDGLAQIRVAQHVLLYPSILLTLTVFAFIMLGEAVRNALDPKLR
ncbi:ABC transporter permease [Streptomyces sp. SPB074]|uniref:ABC transporter permease n=1 Tax=Streptomyces sp. (strain SPB074) TaxID=465543 RepID=UPI00017F1EBF|nr:ABC transporter permease [Streptomyces sp. SPB074]EDY44494.1 oligopeptide ABC transporter, permease OppC [Streptomyces sp. SPB074]